MGGLLIACALDFAFCGAVLLAGIGFGGPWFWVAVAYVLYRTLAGFMHGLDGAAGAAGLCLACTEDRCPIERKR